MAMVYTAIALFSIAALLGMFLLSLVLQKKETPKAIAFIHGLFAAVALVILLIYTFRTEPDLTAASVLFVIAAIGGFVLIARDLMGKSLPKSLAVAHGLLAVTGFVFLLAYAFSQ